MKISIVTESSIYNTLWFLGVVGCYATHAVHVVWTFIYKVQIIPEIKNYQTLNAPRMRTPPKPRNEVLGVDNDNNKLE